MYVFTSGVENNEEPDQVASSEVSWFGSAVFLKHDTCIFEFLKTRVNCFMYIFHKPHLGTYVFRGLLDFMFCKS